MKKDDFFVVSYKILAYLYEWLKAGEEPDMAEISAEALGINEKYWHCIMRSQFEERRITGGKYAPSYVGGDFLGVKHPAITETGIAFLQDNSSISKAKKFLMDIKAMVPGI